jgi:1-acyl-sn-glycerol-3-phosphate acyltransferase
VALTPAGVEREGEGGGNVPGRGVTFEPDLRLTWGYSLFRGMVVGLAKLLFRPSVTGSAHVPAEGPVILAPVHRSFADFCFLALVTDRKLFYMAKDELWRSKLLARLLPWVGAFPVHRESADRQSMRLAERVLEEDGVLVLFPEGTRKEGPEVVELMEGAAFLAARTGAPLVPVGIGGSDVAMPKGKLPRPHQVRIVVGEPMEPPARGERGRVSRSRVHLATEELRRRIQAVYDEART